MIEGFVYDKNGTALSNVDVELKNDDFETVKKAATDENGYFCIDVNEGFYPFMMAVRDYATENLEYWAQNIDASKYHSFEICIDKIELYGLNVFKVKGGGKKLFVYFRPMNLLKFLNKDENIAPDFTTEMVEVFVDKEKYEILSISKIDEQLGEGKTTPAFLMQVSFPDTTWEQLMVRLYDVDGSFGMASTFNVQDR